jgi:hypothetical protein
LAAIKDPRIRVLAPIWIEAAARAGIPREDLQVVHVFRDPAEVVLSHRGLLEDPSAALSRLAGVLGVRIEPERLGRFAEGAVSRDLYRSRPTEADRQAVSAAFPVLRPMVVLLEEATTVPVAPEDLRDRIRGLWNDPACRDAVLRASMPALGRLNRKSRQSSVEVTRLRSRLELERREQAEALGSLRAELERMAAAQEAERADLLRQMEERVTSRKQVIARLRAERDVLLAYRDELLASASWRVTAPLRVLGALARRVALASRGTRSGLRP